MSFETSTDLRVMSVSIDDDRLTVELMDGRAISVPLAWYPRLANASQAERENWELAGAGYGIHWPDIDEDLSTQGLLQGARAPRESSPPDPGASQQTGGSLEEFERIKAKRKHLPAVDKNIDVDPISNETYRDIF